MPNYNFDSLKEKKVVGRWADIFCYEFYNIIIINSLSCATSLLSQSQDAGKSPFSFRWEGSFRKKTRSQPSENGEINTGKKSISFRNLVKNSIRILILDFRFWSQKPKKIKMTKIWSLFTFLPILIVIAINFVNRNRIQKSLIAQLWSEVKDFFLSLLFLFLQILLGGREAC